VTADDSFGAYVSLAKNGTMMAVSATGWDGASLSPGAIYIFDWDGNSWVQRGSPVTSGIWTGAADGFGTGNLTEDGKFLFTSCPNYASNAGVVLIYKWNEDTDNWVLIQDQQAPTPGSTRDYGQGMDVSKNGVWLAVGEQLSGSLSSAGKVYIYKLNLEESNESKKTATRLLRLDEQNNGYFGNSISSYGDWLVVGATHYTDTHTNQGKVYVYNRSSETDEYVLYQTLYSPTPLNSTPPEHWYHPDLGGFGSAVATDGWKIAVTDHPQNKVRIYEWNVSTNLFELSYSIDAPAGSSSSSYGWGCSLSFGTNGYGNWLAVGEFFAEYSPGDNDYRGAVHIYKETSQSVWTLYQTMKPGLRIVDSTGVNLDTTGSYYGFAVALYENFIHIGIPGLYYPSSPAGNKDGNRGCVDTYEITASLSWHNFRQRIWSPTINDPDTGFRGQMFGSSLSTAYAWTGGSLAIGAIFDDEDGVLDAGRIYIYVGASSDSLSHRLTFNSPFKSSDQTRFGTSIGWYYNEVIVGVPRFDNTETNSGEVHRYNWYELDAARPNSHNVNPFGYVLPQDSSKPLIEYIDQGTNKWQSGGPSHRFGRCIHHDNDRKIISAPSYNYGRTLGVGKVYVYDNGDNLIQEITPPSSTNYESGLQFGNGLASDNGRLFITAALQDVGGLVDAGRIHIYEWDGSKYVYSGDTITSPTPVASGFFGYDMDYVSGKLIANEHGARKVHVFEDTGNNTFSLIQTIYDPSVNDYGLFVSGNGNQLVIGSHRDSTVATESGKVELFEFNGSQYVKVREIYSPNQAAGDLFCATKLTDDYLFVGSFKHPTLAANKNGEVHVYRNDKVLNNFEYLNTITASDAGTDSGANNGNRYYGVYVDYYNGKLFVGAEFDDEAVIDAGSVYSYDMNEQWNIVPSLQINQPAGISNGDRFGSSVSLNRDGSRIVITSYAGGTGDSGVISTFNKNTTYVSTGLLTESINPISNGEFGRGLTISADGLTLYAGLHLYDGGTVDSGSVEVFDYNSSLNRWDYRNSIYPTTPVNTALFGRSVDVSTDGSIVVIGSPGVNTFDGEIDTFNFISGKYSPAAVTFPYVPEEGDKFVVYGKQSHNGTIIDINNISDVQIKSVSNKVIGNSGKIENMIGSVKDSTVPRIQTIKYVNEIEE
jgi:hypothetical protein